MDWKKYQNLAERTDAPLENNYAHIRPIVHIFHIMKSLGEIADVYKKNLAYGKDIDYKKAETDTLEIMGKINFLFNIVSENGLNHDGDEIIQYENLHAVHMLLGFISELSELVDPFIVNIEQGKEIDWVNVGEELADSDWYKANFCRVNDLDMPTNWQKNITKLQARYPNKFSTEDALNRDLDKERKILEGEK